MSGDESVGDVAGKRVILVDDLISSGGTILRAVDACRRAGARRVDVAVPHGAFGPEAYRLFAENGPDSVLITDLVTVDTCFSPYFEPIAACSRGCTALRGSDSTPGGRWIVIATPGFVRRLFIATYHAKLGNLCAGGCPPRVADTFRGECPQTRVENTSRFTCNAHGASRYLAIEIFYRTMLPLNFARHILLGQEFHLRAMRVPSCGWSDLGTPWRVAQHSSGRL